MARKSFHLACALVALAIFVAMVKTVADSPEKYQWDFKIYYLAAQAQSQGLNPYDAGVASAFAGQELKYLYPPLALNFFRLFALMDYDRAALVFLMLKSLMFLSVVVLWRGTFIRHVGPFYYLFCVLAFKSVVFIDLRAGNVAIVELFLIGTGLFAFLKRKYLLFGVLVCAAGVFKITPACLLILFAFAETKNRYRFLAVFTILFVVVQGAFFYLEPHAAQNFVANSLLSEERAYLNPALLPIMKDFAAFVTAHTGLLPAKTTGVVFYAVALLVILGVSGITLVRRDRSQFGTLFVAMFILSVYLVVMPRVKDYSYVLALLPTLYVVSQYAARNAAWPLLFMFMIADNYLTPFLSDFVLGFYWSYYPYFLAFVAWLMFLGLLLEPVAGRKTVPAKLPGSGMPAT